LQRTAVALVPLLACLASSLAEAAPAPQPKAVLQGEFDKTLKADLQRTIGEARAPPDSRIEARRRAREAATDALSLLRSEGYYDAGVVADVSESDPPVALLKVTPGPRFTLKDPRVEWTGHAPAPGPLQAASRALALETGTPGRAADVLAAEGRVVVALNKLGYADARAEPREVVVDHADHTVRPTFRIAAGPLVRLGSVRVATHGRTNPGWVASLAPWKRGAIYDPASLAKFERRLTETGVYESVTVALAPPDQSPAGPRPVLVTLTDRPRRTLELGAAYSTTAGSSYDASTSTTVGSTLGAYSSLQGSGFDAKWIHYNLLGRADTLTLTGRLYDIQQVLDLQLALPDWMRADQTLKLGVDALNERTPAYDDTGGGLRMDVERHWTKTSFFTVGGYLDYVTLSQKDAVNPEATPVGEQLKLLIPTGLVGFAIDHSNDPLNPTRGWRLDARILPTWVTGDRNLVYLTTQAQASGYLPLDSNADTVLAARIKLGSILGGDLPGVPADRRFYSGGGGSVRGFAYQAVGPRLSDNTPEGGLSLAETSFEVRRMITARWGVVAFVDAGSVGVTEAPDFTNVSTGVGVGVRYDLGFGPLRFDIATPLDPREGDSAVQVYLSIGQSF